METDPIMKEPFLLELTNGFAMNEWVSPKIVGKIASQRHPFFGVSNDGVLCIHQPSMHPVFDFPGKLGLLSVANSALDFAVEPCNCVKMRQNM